MFWGCAHLAGRAAQPQAKTDLAPFLFSGLSNALLTPFYRHDGDDHVVQGPKIER